MRHPPSTAAQLSFFAQPPSWKDLSLRGGLLLSSARICLHWWMDLCVLCFGSLAQGELWKCSFCVRHLLALQALFLLRLRLPFSRKLLWKFRFLGLLLLLLPSL